MTLNSSIQVDLPDKDIVIRGGRYRTVLKVVDKYKNDSGNWTPRRVGIGVFDASTGKLIPNAKYWELYGDDFIEPILLPGKRSVRDIGPSFVIGRIMSDLGVAGILDQVLGSPRSQLVQTAATYMVARNNAF